MLSNTKYKKPPGEPGIKLIGATVKPPGSQEIFDDSLILYYLQNLPECRINVAKGLALLYELEENEDQIYEALSLRSRSNIITTPRLLPTSDYDHGFLQLHEQCQKEQKMICQERILLQNHLKIENQRLMVIEGSIFTLPEPHRSVMMARYLERQTWQQIQRLLKKSASRTYIIHKEALREILSTVKTSHLDIGRLGNEFKMTAY